MQAKKTEQRYIYALRNRTLPQGKGKPETNLIIGSLAHNFVLAIGRQPQNNTTDGHLVEQEKTKFGQYLYSFESKNTIKLLPENVLVCFPLTCTQEDDRFLLTEQEFKKFIVEFKTVMTHEDSDDSSYSHYSESQLQISSIDHRCRGRPKGSKNRRKPSIQKSSEEEFLDDSHKKFQEKRGRGRPKGAKNIKKLSGAAEGSLNELSVFQLFVSLFETQSIEEVNTKIHRLKDRDDRLLMGDQLIKRSRGRPKGVKNKPKLNNEESESEQTTQQDSLPKRRTARTAKCCAACQQKEQKRLFLEGKNVAPDKLVNVCEPLGVDNHSSLMLATIRKGDPEQLKQVLSRKDALQNAFVVSWDASSRLQDCYYTVRTRKKYISKGGRREGLHALLQDCLRTNDTLWWKTIGVERILENVPNCKQAPELYELMVQNDTELKREIYLNLASLVRSGNETLAAYLFEKVLKEDENQSSFGYSKDHLECLNKKRNEMQFKKAAMLKQSYTANFCSPIHCAIINSNTDLLTFILKHISDCSVGDSANRKPVHYAAVLENSKALEILIKHGADLKDIDKRKTTPLMLAARSGRTKNLKLILDKVRDVEYINFKGEEGLAALHYAAIEKHQDCLTLLLDDPLVEVQIETREGMNIFHLAAGNGQKELIKLLLEKEFTPEADHFRRTPLMLAIRNHQNDVFFQLFQSCPRYYKRDYSYNTLLHYAAAYGNIEVVRYLLDLGMTQTMNRKSFYPFEIAILKGHYHCAKLLENWSLHFSHHLPNRLSKTPRGTPEYFQIYEYLLETRKYDLNYRNPMAYGNTCLHFVCSISEPEYYHWRRKESSNPPPNEYRLMQERLITLLLKYGADPDLENDRGEKPLKLCIQNENMMGMQLLLREIPFDLHPPTRNNNYVYYLTNIACLGWQEMEFTHSVLLRTDERLLREELRKVDINGFEFLIFLIKRFTETVHLNFRNKYANYKEQIQQTQDCPPAQVERKAVLQAFEDYLKHEDGLVRIVNYLVDMGSDPKFTVLQPKMEEEFENYKKWGIQHFLMKFPSLNLLKIFMRWIDTNFNLQNSEGRTPLHLFCLWNNEGSLFNHHTDDPLPHINYPEMAQFTGTACLGYLLENGLTPNVLDINRSTPLLYATMRAQLAFVKLLRNFGSTINNVNSLNQVPLIELIRMKNRLTLPQIETILSDQILRADFRDLNERNALHHAVSIAKNFDNSPQICRKLIHHGVNINSLDKHGRSPLFYCFIKIEQNECSNDDSNDKVQILQTLLTHPEININIVDVYQRTPLHYACEKKFFFSIIYLLEKNIDYDRVDAEGNTPLAICLKHRNLNQAAMLIKRGVKYGNVVEDAQVYSYITYAIKKLSVGICFILIDHGYPLDRALEQSHPFKEILLKRYVK